MRSEYKYERPYANANKTESTSAQVFYRGEAGSKTNPEALAEPPKGGWQRKNATFGGTLICDKFKNIDDNNEGISPMIQHSCALTKQGSSDLQGTSDATDSRRGPFSFGISSYGPTASNSHVSGVLDGNLNFSG